MPYKPDQREYRAMPLLQAQDAPAAKRLESDYYVEGYATTYDQPYEMGVVEGETYYEQIDRGALDSADLSDVIMQYDHQGRVLARQSNGTLLVEPAGSHGLFVAADLSRSAAARDIYGDIQAGLIDGMSWAFTIADGGDYFDRATHTRHITRIRKVYDVSAVSIPANPATDIAARSYCERRAAEEKQEVADNLAKREKVRAECAALLSL